MKIADAPDGPSATQSIAALRRPLRAERFLVVDAADALLAKKNCSPQELLERIKVMSARKRGPRKGSQRQAPMLELARAS